RRPRRDPALALRRWRSGRPPAVCPRRRPRSPARWRRAAAAASSSSRSLARTAGAARRWREGARRCPRRECPSLGPSRDDAGLEQRELRLVELSAKSVSALNVLEREREQPLQRGAPEAPVSRLGAERDQVLYLDQLRSRLRHRHRVERSGL